MLGLSRAKKVETAVSVSGGALVLARDQSDKFFSEAGLASLPMNGHFEPWFYLWLQSHTGDYDILWIYPKKMMGEPLSGWVDSVRGKNRKNAYVYFSDVEQPAIAALAMTIDLSCAAPEAIVQEDPYRIALRCGPSLLRLMVGVPGESGMGTGTGSGLGAYGQSPYASSMYMEDSRAMVPKDQSVTAPGAANRLSSVVQAVLGIAPLEGTTV